MLTKEVLINSLRPYCGVIMEYDRRSGRLCLHWCGALTDSMRQRWFTPAQLREEIRRSGTAVSEEAAVWYQYLNVGYLQGFFRRGAESEEFRMEFQTSDRRMKRYDIRIEKLDADTLLIFGRVVREDGVDALTSVYSRSYYEMHMKTGAVRGGVAIIDLDDLKLCNDTYGHDGGDKLLTAAAQVMQDAAGMDGQVVRYGGDEFLLLLPGAGENDFPAVLEDIRARIAALRLPEQSGLRLTASIGGVIARDETVADAVLRADRLMYRAKQRKDCVVLEGQAADDSTPEEQAPLLLVVDDAPLNRELLMAMLGDEYRYLEASDGAACLKLLEQYGTGIEMVLLDMVMPGMDGIRVLEEMNRRHYIEDIPVVLVTADDSGQYIRRAYELGVADYISRPFDAQVVYRRVTNTVRLYARQRRLRAMLARSTQWQRRREQVMIDVLGRIVGFRSGESAEHVRHVNQLTARLLDRLTEISGAYRLTQADCVTISTASALHDVGKTGVDQGILNKPGRLTPEEFEAVKQHTVIGEELLRGMREYRGEPLLETAAEICRWHHERYDGGGYPDGLKGDDIPISAQVVSLADVYDALVSRRVYKDAYTPEQAMEMIRDGQCGVFNPVLVQCLTDIQDALRTEVYAGDGQPAS